MSDLSGRSKLDLNELRELRRKNEYYLKNGFPECWNGCGCKHWLCSSCNGRGFVEIGNTFYMCNGCGGWMYGYPCDSIRKHVPK